MQRLEIEKRLLHCNLFLQQLIAVHLLQRRKLLRAQTLKIKRVILAFFGQ